MDLQVGAPVQKRTETHRTMASTVPAVVLLAIVASLGAQAKAQLPDVTVPELANLIGGDIFKLPDIIASLGVDIGGAAGDNLLGKLPCRVGPAEDEDACRNVSEIIRSRGFEVENYEVTTDDGYILSIQKVVNPLVAEEDRHKLKAVILQHGIFGVSTEWIFNDQHARPARWPPQRQPDDGNVTRTKEDEGRTHPRSLAFYLANRGYAVYLPNSRGNVYSQKHVSKSIADPSYWNFSWDEQIDYDLPAVIKFVQEKSGQSKIPYVGFSQGTTIMFGLLADRPEYADIIEPFIALSPIAYLSNTKSQARLFLPLIPYVQDMNIGFAYTDVYRFQINRICGPTMAQKVACIAILGQLIGDDRNEFDVDRMQTITRHMPTGTSAKNLVHYAQMIMNGKFSRYNFGLAGNKKRYGTALPPEYNLTNIRLESIALVTADNDLLATPEDVQQLASQLRSEPIEWHNMTEYDPNWNHLAYLYHKRLGTTLNPIVAGILDKFNHCHHQYRCNCKRRKTHL